MTNSKLMVMEVIFYSVSQNTKKGKRYKFHYLITENVNIKYTIVDYTQTNQ